MSFFQSIDCMSPYNVLIKRKLKANKRLMFINCSTFSFQGYVSLKRISKFLTLDEIEPSDNDDDEDKADIEYGG